MTTFTGMRHSVFLLIFLTATIPASARRLSSRQFVQDVVAFHYPPFIIHNQSGEQSGLEIDIFQAALGKADYKLRYRFYPIPRATQAIRYSELNNHPIYIGTSLHFKDEIKRGDVYSICIGQAKFVAFTHSGSAVAKMKDLNIEKLKPFRVAALRGSSILDRLKQAGIQPLEARSFEQFFFVLEQKKVDASIVLELAGETELKRIPRLRKSGIMKVDSPLMEIPLAIVISKDHPQASELHLRLRNRLIEMRRNGELKAIAEKYYGIGQVPDEFFRE